MAYYTQFSVFRLYLGNAVFRRVSWCKYFFYLSLPFITAIYASGTPTVRKATLVSAFDKH